MGVPFCSALSPVVSCVQNSQYLCVFEPSYLDTSAEGVQGGGGSGGGGKNASPGPGRIWDRVAACCDVEAHSATNPIQASNPIPAPTLVLIHPPLAESNYSFRPSSQDIVLEIPVQQPLIPTAVLGLKATNKNSLGPSSGASYWHHETCMRRCLKQTRLLLPASEAWHGGIREEALDQIEPSGEREDASSMVWTKLREHGQGLESGSQPEASGRAADWTSQYRPRARDATLRRIPR
ncbi:hypothetical protein QCA50_000054 [Cerrena zonata]|uniref:Uncharacterized protein n=1 Tax=Cerrena zonata TaxID=2478898 RepID=A0AAW0GX75_9APHY